MKNWDIRQLVFIITIVLAFRLSFETPAQAAPLVQDTTHCVALNEAGASLYFRAQYAEAIQKFQEALACYRDAPAGGRAGEGTTLNNIGEVYRAQGRYAEALESYQQALAIHHKVGNRAEEGITLNNISLVYYHEGRYAEALAQLQQALVIRREVSDQAGEGDILNNIGVLYKAQGRYAKALENYQQALAVAREADDRAGAGGILNNIGKVYQAQGHYTEALEMYQQALAVAREVGDRAGEGTILNNIGWVYDNQGRYAEALKMYQQALVIRRDIDDRAGEGATLNSIGLVYEAQGHYAEALAQLQQALLIQQRMGAPAAEGTTLNNIGVVYTHQGCYVEALEAYQQALVICQEIGDRAGEGTALNNIGCIYWTQERYDEALALLQQTLVIRREIGDRAGEGNSLNNIGAVYRDQGRYIEALEMFQQALLILCEVGNRAMEGDTLNNIGAVYRDQGRYAEALEMYRQALMIRREIGDRAREGTTLNNTGVVYQAQERYAEALDAYRQAMDAFEAVRAVAGSEQGRAGFITQHAGLYTRAASLFHQQGQDEEAFFTSERGRARAFLDSLATGHVELTDGEAAALLAQEQEAYTARQAAQDALIRVRALDPSTGSGQTPPDPSLVADLEAQLAEAEAAHVEALTAVEARGDQLAALVPGRSTVLGLSDVQALLNEETTLLSYFVLEDQTLAFLITRTGFEVVAIEVSRQELADRVSYFRDVIPFRQPEAAQPAAQELYQLLIAPLSSSLRTSRLMIVPHGPLHYLPFAALVDPATGQTLLDRYTLITLPSASALPFIQQNRTPPADSQPSEGSALILGNPATRDPDLSPLIFAAREAQTVASLYQTQPLLGESATESAVWKRAHQTGVLHLAAHSGYNPHNPLYSAIALAPDAANDGRLEVHEIYGLDLASADIVVLSGCQTQLGELSAGDELVGLTRAFVFAGAPTVVATLWSVDDEATALLMESFYAHLREGRSKAEALRQAQLEVQETHPEPYYWAGFVLSGDGGEVSGMEILAPMGTIVPTIDQSPQETPVPLSEPQSRDLSGQVWLAVGAGSLIIAILTGVIWWRRVTHRFM